MSYRPLLLLLAACTPDVPSDMLTRIDLEYAGVNCANGGLVLYEGQDLNGSDALDDDEIERATYQCAGEVPDDYQGVWLGDCIVRSQADIDGLAGKDTITGDLVLLGAELATASFPSLRVVGGVVRVGDGEQLTAVGQVALPNLAILNGGVELRGNPLLTAVDLGTVQAVGQDAVLLLHDDPLLASISGLDVLQTVSAFQLSGDVHSFSLADLRIELATSFRVLGTFAGDLSLPSLRDVYGELQLSPARAEETLTLDLPSLTHAGSVELRGGQRIADARLPVLEVVDDSFVAHESPVLETLALSRLREVSGGLEVSSVGALSVLELPSLVRVGGHIVLTYATMLTAFEVPRLAEVGGDVDVRFASKLELLAFPEVQDFGGRLKLQDSGFLDIELPALRTVHGSLWVTRNSALVHVNLGRMTTVGTWMTLQLAIEANPLLAQIDLNASRLDVNGGFVVRGNLSLPSVAMFAPLRTVTGNFDVAENPLVDPCEVRSLLNGLASPVGGTTNTGAGVCGG